MRSMILAAAVVGALTFGWTPAHAQVGVVVGNPVYGTGVAIGQPYNGFGGYYPGYGVVTSGLGYRVGGPLYTGTTFYSSGYRGLVAPGVGVVAPGVGVVAAPVTYGPVYYRRGLLGRRYYRAW